jgi:hypothetical protein
MRDLHQDNYHELPEWQHEIIFPLTPPPSIATVAIVEVEIASKFKKLLLREGLHKSVSKLIICRYELYINDSRLRYASCAHKKWD